MNRRGFLAAALAVAGLQATATAGPPRPVALVDGWYRQYLGRCADECGLKNWVEHLRCKSPDEVLSHILGSEEYYHRNGCCESGFIKGLYKDRLGRCASPAEVRDWLCELRRCGCRQKLALKFLCASKRELAGW
jgi:hypothetical protein